METRIKDPVRVRTGRLGALTIHAQGKTNTGPARAAWLAKIAASVDPAGALTPHERDRRIKSAIRLRMAAMSHARWAKPRTTKPAMKPVDPLIRALIEAIDAHDEAFDEALGDLMERTSLTPLEQAAADARLHAVEIALVERNNAMFRLAPHDLQGRRPWQNGFAGVSPSQYFVVDD